MPPLDPSRPRNSTRMPNHHRHGRVRRPLGWAPLRTSEPRRLPRAGPRRGRVSHQRGLHAAHAGLSRQRARLRPQREGLSLDPPRGRADGRIHLRRDGHRRGSGCTCARAPRNARPLHHASPQPPCGEDHRRVSRETPRPCRNGAPGPRLPCPAQQAGVRADLLRVAQAGDGPQPRGPASRGAVRTLLQRRNRDRPVRPHVRPVPLGLWRGRRRRSRAGPHRRACQHGSGHLRAHRGSNGCPGCGRGRHRRFQRPPPCHSPAPMRTARRSRDSRARRGPPRPILYGQ